MDYRIKPFTYKLIYIIYKYSVRTSQRRVSASNRKTNGDVIYVKKHLL